MTYWCLKTQHIEPYSTASDILAGITAANDAFMCPKLKKKKKVFCVSKIS